MNDGQQTFFNNKHEFWKYGVGSKVVIKSETQSFSVIVKVVSISKPVLYEVVLIDTSGEHIPVFCHKKEARNVVKQHLSKLGDLQFVYTELKPVDMEHITSNGGSTDSSPRSPSSTSTTSLSESVDGEKKRFSLRLSLRRSSGGEESSSESSPKDPKEQKNSPKSPKSPSLRRLEQTTSPSSPKRGSPRHQSMFAELIAKSREKYDFEKM